MLGVAGLLLVGLLAVPALLPPAAADVDVEGGGPTTPTTSEAPTTTTTAVTPVQRPDAWIRRFGANPFSGNNIINLDGAGQSRTTEVEARATATFIVRVENDGNVTNDIRVVGTRGDSRFAVRYHDLERDVRVTDAVVGAGGYTVQDLDPTEWVDLRVEIQALGPAGPGTQRRVVISTRPTVVGVPNDNVVAIAKRPLFSTEQRRIGELVNDSRRGAGRSVLTLHRQLTTKAQAWAERLARTGRLEHSSLPAGVPAGWTGLAENVGNGSTIAVVHTAFMNSSGHRTNILGPYNFIGTGYAEGRGRAWIVHVFMRR